MIYDCFLYNGEKELLEMRLNELSKCDSVVTHVLVEAAYTHTGVKKSLYFDDCKADFEDWPIVSISVEKFKDTDVAKEREAQQRNMIIGALKFLMPSDKSVVIISDVDEIPDHKKINYFCSINQEFAAIQMKKYGYYLNWLESNSWDRARIMRYGYLKDKSPEDVRNSGYETLLMDAGWHFSWLHDKAQEKLRSFSHTELNTGSNTLMIEGRRNFWNELSLSEVPIDESFPEYLVNNIDKYKHLIHV
jgi:beta-1,4-mannosyl-glycoprotein beta-1,4-N-acetylglucosaminyltransferase